MDKRVNMNRQDTKEADFPNPFIVGLNSSEKYLGEVARYSVLGLSLLCLIWISWHAFYAIPSADDFCIGGLATKKGILGTIEYFYLTWTGRYSSTLLIAAFAESHELLTRLYFFVPLFILLSIFCSAYHFLKRIGINDHLYLVVFFCGVVAAFSFRETIFWLSGGGTYGLAIAIFWVIAVEEMNIFFKDLYPSWRHISILCIATLLLAGFNETIMIAHVAFLVPLLASSVMRKKNRALVGGLALVLITAIMGAFVVKFAPGNAVRIDAAKRALGHPLTLELVTALKNSLVWSVQQYWKFFLLSLLLFYSSVLLMAPNVKRPVPTNCLFTFCLFLWFALWGAIFTRAFVLNSMGPVRAQTIDFFLVCIMSFCSAWSLYLKDQDRIGEIRKISPVLVIFVGIFVLTLAFRAGADGVGWKTVLVDLKYGRPLKDFMSARLALAEHTKGKKLEVIDYANKRQSMTFFDDITGDPADWRNGCFADYFGLKEVRLKTN